MKAVPKGNVAVFWRFYMITLKKAWRDSFGETSFEYLMNLCKAVHKGENFLIDHFLSFVQIVPCPFLKPSF